MRRATQNPTGYAQVVSESITGNTATQPYDYARTYVYGLERLSQQRSYVANNQGQTQTSYYVYDGHGSTRALTDPSGNVTDTYDYDAFGNLLHSTATGIPPGSTTVAPTPNEFLFAGEQFDSDLNLYYTAPATSTPPRPASGVWIRIKVSTKNRSLITFIFMRATTRLTARTRVGTTTLRKCRLPKVLARSSILKSLQHKRSGPKLKPK